MPAPQVTPLIRPRAPSSTPCRMRSAAAISHSTFMWMRPCAVRALVGDAGLMDAAGDGEANQLLMALAPGAAVIDLGHSSPVLVEAVGIDAGEGADAAGRPPRRPSFSPFDTEMPLPPSTSGSTSRPDTSTGLSGLHGVDPPAAKLSKDRGPTPQSRHATETSRRLILAQLWHPRDGGAPRKASSRCPRRWLDRPASC